MKSDLATAKAEETRRRILKAALDLFRRRGFERTTMREIASEAEVSTGAAYYYFDSKEAIVMAFYERSRRELQPRIASALETGEDFESRLRALIEIKLEYFGPNRAFLGALLRHVADPNHPLSPFSDETREIREADIASFSEAVRRAEFGVSKDLLPHLPRLLWLYQMAMIFYWLADGSPDQRRTGELLERSLRLIVSLLKLARLPLMRPLRRMVIELIETATPGAA